MTALLIIATILLLLMALAAFGNKQLNIERNIVINKPVMSVYEYVRFIKNHDNFSVWAMMDPEMKKEFRGTDGTVGFVYAWDSIKKKNVGAGEQEIKSLEDNKRIEHEIRFTRPMQDVAIAIFHFESLSENETKVIWDFKSTMKFPMNIMKPMMQNILGKSMETGLQNLKNVLEK